MRRASNIARNKAALKEIDKLLAGEVFKLQNVYTPMRVQLTHVF